MSNLPTTPKDKTPLPAHANGAGADPKPSPAPLIDLATLSDQQLDALLIGVGDEMALRKAKKDADFLASVAETARALNIPPARVAAAIRGTPAPKPDPANPHDRRHFVKAQLWNPKDHSQRWSKRGAAPKWYVDHIAAGGAEDECVIPDGEV